MTKCISFGKIEKKFIYILFIYIIMNICLLIIDEYGFKNDSDYEFYDNNKIINEIMYYINQSFLYVFEFIRKRQNSISNVNNSKINNPFKIKILFIGLISLIELIDLFGDIFLNSTDIFEIIDLDTNYINLLFLLFSSYCFMKYSFYKHHYFVVIILLIIGNINNLIFVLLIKESLLNIFPLLIKSILVSILYGLYKKLMDKYYFSPYKLSYIIGLINMTILLIICIVFTYIPCNENMKSFCLIENEEQNYFINLKSYFSYENLHLIIFSFIVNIIYSIRNLLIKMIIQDFTIFHTFIPIRLSNFTFDLDMAYKCIEKIKHEIILLIIILVFYVIELIISLVFLEFIELNFCGISKNIKRNIRKRAQIDPIDIRNSEENLIMIDDQYYTGVEDKNENDDESENENDILEMTKTTN